MRKNVPLLVGLSIPVLMIIFVAASIYIPNISYNPKTNFLYLIGGDNYSRDLFKVEDGKLVKKEFKYPENYIPKEPDLKMYYVKTNESVEISLEEAQKLRLDSSSKSPDGYEIVRGDNPEGLFSLFFDGWRNRNCLYLKSNGKSRALKDPNTGRSYYYYNMHFIGWIIEKE